MKDIIMRAGSQRHYTMISTLYFKSQHTGLHKGDYFQEEITEESAKHDLLG